MQEYRGQYLQVFSAIQEYESDLLALGRETAAQLVGKIHHDPRTRDPFQPRLALVLFTQVDDGTAQPNGEAPPGLSQLCAGINGGLSGGGAEGAAVPVIGCSVASIPDPQRNRILRRGFSITVLAARRHDLEALVGGAPGLVEKEDGHETAWTECLKRIEDQDRTATKKDRPDLEDRFILAFFPGLVAGAVDFKARGLASYEFLRSKISADLAIYGAGAGEVGGHQRRCQVMAGPELIADGYVCAKIRTTLRFKMSMDHNLETASEALLVKEIKEGPRGRSIVSFSRAVPELVDAVPARQVLGELQEKYGTQDFAFQALELSGKKESLLFLSVNLPPKEDFLTLSRPVTTNTIIRPAYFDRSGSFLSRDLMKSLSEDSPVALTMTLICNGIFKLSGTTDKEREESVLRQLQEAQTSRGAAGFCMASGFVFGEWGVESDQSGRAQYYHATSLTLIDALMPRHQQRRQLEIIDRCSRDMQAALLAAEASDARLTPRRAAAALASPLFDAVEDLGYDGGLIWLANEADQTLVGTEARGDLWRQVQQAPVVRMDEADVLARTYRQAYEGTVKHGVVDCRREPSCPREAKVGIAAQTVVPLWDGRRCLGLLQVGHPPQPLQVIDFEGSALVDIAHHLALHLRQVRARETAREIDEAVRFAIASEDQEAGWSFFAQVAARAVEVPFCTVRVLDSSLHFLKLVGGSLEILEPTLSYRPYTPVDSHQGPVVKAYHRFKERKSTAEANAEIYVIDDSTQDLDLRELAGSEPRLARIYKRIGSYALGSLTSAEQGCVGVISFLSFQPGFFTPERKELVQKIAGDASIVAKAYKAVRSERFRSKSTLALATIQEEVNKIVGALGKDDTGLPDAAKLLVTETAKHLPCEACTLHLFSNERQLCFQAGAPDDLFNDGELGNTLTKSHHDFLLHLALQRDIYRAAGDDLREQSRVQAGTWAWLPKTQQLHSVLAIPLADLQGRSYGLLALFNQLNDVGKPDDALDFTDVHTRIRRLLQETATHVVDNFRERDLYMRLAAFGDKLELRLESCLSSQDYVNPDEFFCDLARMLAHWLDGQICSVFLIKHPEKQLELRGSYGWKAGDKLHRVHYDMGEGLTGALAEAVEPVVIPSIFVDARRIGKYETEIYGPPDSNRTYELIALPLRQGDEPIGLITVYRKLPVEQAHALGFNPQDGAALRLASHLAKLAVVAVEGRPRSEQGLEYERPAIAEILSAAGQRRLDSLNYNELAERISARFGATLCGIFLADTESQSKLSLYGATGRLASFVEKVQVEQDAGPIGQAFANKKTEFRDLPEHLRYMGQLDATLRQCLDEPPTNLMAAPMLLGEECEGVILLVNRNVFGHSEQSAKALPRFHLETLGTGILLVRHNVEFYHRLQEAKRTIGEQRAAIHVSSERTHFAHACKRQLQHIQRAISYLELHELDPRSKANQFTVIESTCNEISKLIDENLQPTVTEKSAPVDLIDIVQRAVESRKDIAIEHNVRIVVNIDGAPIVLGHRTELTGVVATILENAIEACEQSPRKINLFLREHRLDGLVGLAIADNGRGITTTNLPFIFTRGFTTHSQGKQRGYGLNFARSLVLLHGGDIEVKSSNKGTKVTVWLRGDSSC